MYMYVYRVFVVVYYSVSGDSVVYTLYRYGRVGYTKHYTILVYGYTRQAHTTTVLCHWRYTGCLLVCHQCPARHSRGRHYNIYRMRLSSFSDAAEAIHIFLYKLALISNWKLAKKT